MTQRSVSEYGILGTSLTIYFLAPVSGKKSRAIVIIIVQPTAAASVAPKLPADRVVPSGAVLRQVAPCARMRPPAITRPRASETAASPLHIKHSWPSIGI